MVQRLVHHAKNWCTFCDEFVGKDTSNFRYLFSFDEFPSRVLLQTEHFVVIPGIGSLGSAYLLILPFEPYSSMAALPSNWLPELIDLKSEIERVLTERYTATIAFEHGPATSRSVGTGCCVEHAHIHVVATQIELIDDLRNFYRSRTFEEDPEPYSSYVNAVERARSLLDDGTSYIWYETHQKEQWIFPVNQSIESQFLRKLLASKLDLPDPEWDWALFPRKEQVLETFHQLKPVLESLANKFRQKNLCSDPGFESSLT